MSDQHLRHYAAYTDIVHRTKGDLNLHTSIFPNVPGKKGTSSDKGESHGRHNDPGADGGWHADIHRDEHIVHPSTRNAKSHSQKSFTMEIPLESDLIPDTPTVEKMNASSFGEEGDRQTERDGKQMAQAASTRRKLIEQQRRAEHATAKEGIGIDSYYYPKMGILVRPEFSSTASGTYKFPTHPTYPP